MAPIPGAQRIKLWRENKMRNDPELYAQMKEKDAERKREKRKKEMLSEEEVLKRRQSGKSRTAKWRHLKAMKSKSEKSAIQVTPQALGKAVRRVKRALPNSPRKAKLVMSKLNISQQLFLSTSGKEKKQSEEVIDSFYCRDDISRQAPGKKDYVTLWTKEGKITKQKRHLIMTVYEAYQLFKEQHQNVKVGKSKFAQCRPKHVLTMANLPQNVCLCRFHENMNFLIEACVKLNVSAPKTTSLLVSQSVCDEENERCMLGKCDECCGGKNFVQELVEKHQDRLSEIATWCQWKTVDNIVVKSVIDNRQIGDLFDEMENQITEFILHCFIKRKQSCYFEKQKGLLEDGRVMIQVDFSENYCVQTQDEIQTAHWHHGQVTLFTCVAWMKDECKSYVVVSDYLQHDKYAVNVFLEHLLDDITKKISGKQRKLVFFSDGAASQFKQKFLFKCLTKFAQNYDSEIEWNFFATSHGKGAVDGVGGTVKRVVWRQVLSRKANVHDALSFCETATALTKTSVFFVSADEIQKQKTKLDKFWTDCYTIPGTQKSHQISVVDENVVNVKIYSECNEGFVFDLSLGNEIESKQKDMEGECVLKDKLPPNKSLISSYVLVRFQTKRAEKKYVGCVTGEDLGMKEFEVCFLRKVPKGANESQSVYVYPEREDKVWVGEEDVLMMLPVPTLNNRGHVHFTVAIESQ